MAGEPMAAMVKRATSLVSLALLVLVINLAGLVFVQERIPAPTAGNVVLVVTQTTAALEMLTAQRSMAARRKLNMTVSAIAVRRLLKLKASATLTTRPRQMPVMLVTLNAKVAKLTVLTIAALSVIAMQTAQAALVGQTQDVLKPR